METPEAPLLWQQSGWRAEAHAWIAFQLNRLRLVSAGSIDPFHVRPWATVLRVPINDGMVYFKAVGPELAHEVALACALGEWGVENVPGVLATDVKRRWMLLRDAGEMLRAHLQGPEDLTHWEAVLPRYAALQRALAPCQAELLALGVPDRRLHALPSQYEALLNEGALLRLGQPDGLSHDAHRRLLSLAPAVGQMCARLAAYGLPETLQHDDFHDGNVFFKGNEYTFADWGDGCVSHPFFTLLVTLRSTAHRLELAEDDPALAQLLDLYLNSWTDFLPLPDLHEAWALARRLAMVCRALAWGAVVAPMAPAWRKTYGGGVWGWLEAFLEGV